MPKTLLTIICEALAAEPLKRLLAGVGAHGCTLFRVEGEGSRGLRTGGIQAFANIQVKVIAAPAVAGQLIERLQLKFFSKFAMVASETAIRVSRQETF